MVLKLYNLRAYFTGLSNISSKQEGDVAYLLKGCPLLIQLFDKLSRLQDILALTKLGTLTNWALYDWAPNRIGTQQTRHLKTGYSHIGQLYTTGHHYKTGHHKITGHLYKLGHLCNWSHFKLCTIHWFLNFVPYIN